MTASLMAVFALTVQPDSPTIVRCREVEQDLNVIIEPPSSWSTPHSFFSLEHEIEYESKDDGKVYTSLLRYNILSCILLAAFLWLCFSDYVICLTLDWTFFIDTHPEGDQQAEGSFQRPAGALILESVDCVEKCNPLTLYNCQLLLSMLLHVCNVLLCSVFFLCDCPYVLHLHSDYK